MKHQQILKSSAILFSILGSIICNQSVAASDPASDPSVAIDVYIDPPNVAVTEDEIEKAAADELAAAKKEAEEKAAAIKKEAELKIAKLKAANIKAAEKNVEDLIAVEKKSAELRVPGIKAAEMKLAELKAADLKASKLIAEEIKLAKRRLAKLKGEEFKEDRTLADGQQSDNAGETNAQKIAEVSTSHAVEPGGSLSTVSVKAYSRSGYWRVLKLYNGVSPEKLQVGQEIKAPDLKWLLADSSFSANYPDVADDILKARQIFMEVEDKLASSMRNDVITPSAEDQKQIKLAIDLIQKCKNSLSKKKKGVKVTPSAAIMQLRAASKKMALISSGTKRAASTQNLVHEHLSNTIVYSVLWAKAGFK